MLQTAADVAKGREQGIEVRGPSDHGMIDSIYFRDPNGYVIELCAKRADHDALMDPARNSHVTSCSAGRPPSLASRHKTTQSSSPRQSAHDPCAKPPRHHNRRLVVWLSLAQLITWGSVFYTFALLLEPVERELGLTRAQSSLAFSLALLAEGVFAYPVGRWIDRGHERAVMTGGSLLVVAWPAAAQRGALGGRLLRGLDRAGRGARRHPVHPGVRGGHAALSARFPPRHHHADFPGRAGEQVFIPLSAWLIVAGLAPRAVILAAFHLLVACRCMLCSCATRQPPRAVAPAGRAAFAARCTCAARPSC